MKEKTGVGMPENPFDNRPGGRTEKIGLFDQKNPFVVG